MRHYFKKYLTATLLMVTFVLVQNKPVSAQYYQQDKNIRLGLVFNPNISWLKYDNDISSKAKVGYTYGLVADLGFARNYYFSTGLLINSINSQTENNYNSVDPNDQAIPQNRDIYLKYAEVPLTIKLKSEPSHYGRFYGQFGFTAGVKVSGREKFINETGKRQIEGDDIFRLGLQIGAGAEWNLGSNLGLLTGLAFNNGFTRAINESGSPKNSYVALNIGLLF